MNNRPLVHLYAGDGKGKTTAAIGLAVRAKGAGYRVLVCQFLKGRYTSERAPLEALGISLLYAPQSEKFVFQMGDSEREEAGRQCRELLCQAKNSLGDWDLLVLDEVTDAVDLGLLPMADLLDLLRDPPAEVVLTGHTPDPALIHRADYYTRMTAEKHPYQKGIPAREGIEF